MTESKSTRWLKAAGMRAVKTMAQSALAVCRRLTNERVFLDPLFIETLDKNFIELACFVEC